MILIMRIGHPAMEIPQSSGVQARIACLHSITHMDMHSQGVTLHGCNTQVQNSAGCSGANDSIRGDSRLGNITNKRDESCESPVKYRGLEVKAGYDWSHVVRKVCAS